MNEEVRNQAREMGVALRRFLAIWRARNATSLGNTTQRQYMTLCAVEQFDQCRMGQLAEELGITMGAASNVANALVKAGYLKRIYDSLDESDVLATAGYNAGPTRARRWQADIPLEGAVYVESIPFLETREYVKKVMTNAMFYRSRFGGESRSLKDRLGVVPALQSDASAASD